MNTFVVMWIVTGLLSFLMDATKMPVPMDCRTGWKLHAFVVILLVMNMALWPVKFILRAKAHLR